MEVSMAIRIVTDSASDYTAKEIQKRGIICVPMSVTFGETTYEDGVDLTKEDFFEKLLAGEYPTTAQPSPERFATIFEEAKDAGDDVIAILISSELSGTCQGALLAKQLVGYDRVHVIDSRHATVSMRVLVDEAVKMRDAGSTAQEIVEMVEDLRERIYLVAGLDTLEYLAKGGRISGGAAGFGNLVSLKPIVTVEDGKVVMCGKQIGMRRTYKQVQQFVEAHPRDEAYPVYYLYAHDKTNCLNFVATLKKAGIDFGKPHLRGIGAAIGTHIGAGAFGIVYVEKKEK